MVDSIGDTARKASAGTWRKPRVRIYDYNNDLGSNYYQPMIKYINQKDIYGPFMEKKRVEMPDRPEVSSNKYSNMRYDDKADANMDLDDFLVKAYAKQIKELNSSTAMAHREIIHNSKEPTFFTKNDLLGQYVKANGTKNHYLNQLAHVRQRENRIEDLKEMQAQIAAELALAEQNRPTPEEIEARNHELAKNARCKMFYVYRPITVSELKQWLE